MAKRKNPTPEQLAEAEVLGVEVIGNIGSVALEAQLEAKRNELASSEEIDSVEVQQENNSIVEPTEAESETEVVPEPTPEVVPEPTPEPTPEPEVEKPTTTIVPEVEKEEQAQEARKELSYDEAAKLLKAPGKTIREKLLEIQANGNAALRNLVSKLLSYNEQVGPKAPDRGLPFVTGKNYDLYNTLKQVVETKDQKQFVVKFDIVNLVFLEYSKEAYMDVRLTRGDFFWKWGEKSLETYINLVTIICNLANLETRAKTAKYLINPDKATDIQSTTFTEVAVNNIRKYYS